MFHKISGLCKIHLEEGRRKKEEGRRKKKWMGIVFDTPLRVL
ncbi:hypothetical protein [Okeania hirsuta]